MSWREALAAGVWAGGVFGFLEGIVLTATRPFPAILAPYKGSIHMLWLTPLVDIAVFAGFAVVVGLLRFTRWKRFLTAPLVIASFTFLGLWMVISAPKLIHLAAGAVFALGVASVVYGRIQQSRPELGRQLKWFPLFLVVLALGCFGAESLREKRMVRELPKADRDVRNVLIVVLDTVRYDRFQQSLAQGGLPNLQKLASTGVAFNNAWSVSSWSLPSHASLLTGLPPLEHGAYWPRLALDPSVTTLPEYLSRRGYVTGAFSGNSSWVTPEYLGRGFLRFRAYDWEDLVRRTAPGRAATRVLDWAGFHHAGRGWTSSAVNADFLRFLDEYPNRPFFAYLCYMDVNRIFHRRYLSHPPWEPEPPVEEVVRAYDAGLRKVDADFGAVLDRLRARRALDRTVVVVTADHGESFGAAFNGDHDPKGHATSLYPEQTRVPLIVSAPGGLKGFRPASGAVSIHSTAATVGRLLGWNSSPFTARPLLEPVDTSPQPQPEALLLTLRYRNAGLRAAVFENWLLIQRENGSPEHELYDLRSDPRARTNLYGRAPVPEPIARRFRVSGPAQRR